MSQFSIPSYDFDKDLREVPKRRVEWELFLNTLNSELNKESDPEKQLTLLGSFIGLT